MFQMTPVEREPLELGAVLADLVERFGRATNISSKLVSTLDEAPLSAHTKRELARIVQEALVNVRRHSGAREVLVSVSTDGAHCQLIVDDDGTGFDFEGRLSGEQLEQQGKGPRIIKERVRLLGGSLAVVSRPNALASRDFRAAEPMNSRSSRCTARLCPIAIRRAAAGFRRPAGSRV